MQLCKIELSSHFKGCRLLKWRAKKPSLRPRQINFYDSSYNARLSADFFKICAMFYRQIKIWFQNRRMKFKKEQKQKLMAVPRAPDSGHPGNSMLQPNHQHHYNHPYFRHHHSSQILYQGAYIAAQANSVV